MEYLVWRGIRFDDYTENESGVWSQITKQEAMELGIESLYLDDAGSGSSGLRGGDTEQDSDYYIDFPLSEVRFAEATVPLPEEKLQEAKRESSAFRYEEGCVYEDPDFGKYKIEKRADDRADVRLPGYKKNYSSLNHFSIIPKEMNGKTVECLSDHEQKEVFGMAAAWSVAGQDYHSNLVMEETPDFLSCSHASMKRNAKDEIRLKDGLGKDTGILLGVVSAGNIRMDLVGYVPEDVKEPKSLKDLAVAAYCPNESNPKFYVSPKGILAERKASYEGWLMDALKHEAARMKHREKDARGVHGKETAGQTDITEAEKINEAMHAREDALKELRAMKKERDDRLNGTGWGADYFAHPSVGQEAADLRDAVAWLENPATLGFVSNEDFDDVHSALKKMKESSEAQADRYDRESSPGDSIARRESVALGKAMDFLAKDYAYSRQTEILGVKCTENKKNDCAVVHFRKGFRSGYELVDMDFLRKEQGRDSKAVMQELAESGMFSDLYALPHYSEISPPLLQMYDDARNAEPGEMCYTEADLLALADRIGEDKTPEQLCEEIRADIIAYPAIAEAVSVEPREDGALRVILSNDFRTCIADSYPSERTHRMAPIRGDIPGEEIFRRIEHALDAEGENSCNFNLRDALRNFENLPAQEAIISLKRAANTRDKQEGCSVLHGTMKYETRQDRKKAYQWVRKSMNQSAWDLGEKIYYDELDLKRSKEQGRI